MIKLLKVSVFLSGFLFTFANASLITEGLLAYYTLDGTANDASGNGNNGVITGAVATRNRSGVEGSAMYFDGTGDNIAIPPLEITQSMTLSFWLRTDVVDNNNWPWATFIVDRDVAYTQRDWSVCIGNSGRIQFNTGSTSSEHTLLSSVPVNNDDWVNITVVRDADNQVNQMYLNGILDGTMAFDNLNFSNTNESIYFSQSNCFPEQHKNLRGSLDDVLFYNRALTSTEILEIQDLTGDSNNVPEPSMISLFAAAGLPLIAVGYRKSRRFSKKLKCT